MDVTRQTGRCFQHLPHTERTLHDKRFIDTYQFLYPRINQQIIANGYFYGIGESVIKQSHRKKSRIEYNVTMIRYERIVACFICQLRSIQFETIAMLTDNLMKQFVEKSFLYIQTGFTLFQLRRQRLYRYTRHDAFYRFSEVRIGNQFFAYSLKFVRIIRANVVKLGRYIHSLISLVILQIYEILKTIFNNIRHNIFHA